MDCVIKNKETAYIKPEGLLLPDGRVIPNWSEDCEIQQGANIQIFYVENKKDKKHNDKVLNKGFRYVDGIMKSYEQNKKGLSYAYHKRIVCEDGINTKPLNIKI